MRLAPSNAVGHVPAIAASAQGLVDSHEVVIREVWERNGSLEVLKLSPDPHFLDPISYTTSFVQPCERRREGHIRLMSDQPTNHAISWTCSSGWCE